MAKYAISQEGVSAVRQLEKDIRTNNDSIKTACSQLQQTVNGVESSIGIFADQLHSLIEQVRSAQVQGEEGIETLAGKLNSLASSMDAIISKGLS